ncbi:MAG: hypothetical protein RLZZ326_1081 [Planctomycetota bacterium]
MSRLYSRPAPDAGLKSVPNVPLSMRPVVAARALGISPRTLWSLTKAGLIPHVRMGRCVSYPTAALIRWIEANTINPIVPRLDADDAARGVDGTEVAR